MDNEMTATENMQPPIETQTAITKISGIGTRLRTARETMQLTEKEAGARMHLSTKYITVMENEDFEHGLPSTFMRGYLRSYGRLLNIPEKEIETAIADLGMNTPAKPIVSPLLNSIPDDSTERYVRWLTYLIVFGLISLVAVWWTSHSRDVITDLGNKMTQAAPEQNIGSTRPVSPIAPSTPPQPPTKQPQINTLTAQPSPDTSAPSAFIQGAQQPAQPAPAASTPSSFIQGPQAPQMLPTATPAGAAVQPAGVSVGKTTMNDATDSMDNDEVHSQMAVPEPGLF